MQDEATWKKWFTSRPSKLAERAFDDSFSAWTIFISIFVHYVHLLVSVHLLQSKKISSYLQKINNLCVLDVCWSENTLLKRDPVISYRLASMLSLTEANIACIQLHLEVPQFCCLLTEIRGFFRLFRVLISLWGWERDIVLKQNTLCRLLIEVLTSILTKTNLNT